jgi:cell division protease FtsH
MNMFKNTKLRYLITWGTLALCVLAIYLFQIGGNYPENNFVFSEFLEKVHSKQVVAVKIQDRNLEGSLVGGGKFRTYLPNYSGLVEELRSNGVSIEAVPLESRMNSFLAIILSWVPMVVLTAFWFFFVMQMQGGGGKALGFGKSKAKMLSDKRVKVTFADVAGIEQAKEELEEIVEFLRDPVKFRRLGGSIPKGCLLMGPPGTGKTLLAKAIAGEANVPFFSISGSDFVEMFVGVGASRVRDMFEQGKKNAPCIIFIDEIDAVGRHRGIGLGGGNDEREQTLNQLLVEMDGFEPNDGVVIIAATNRPDVLDFALLRPGRFDRRITVSYPDIEGREKILKVHLKKVKYDPEMDVKVLARGTPGLSGAELANLVNEGALVAARRNKKSVQIDDLEYAKDKILMGAERRSMLIPEKERNLIAYHEGGHAIVSLYVDEADPIHKVTIMPRGQALGMVMRLPETDKISESRSKIESDISVMLGGRIAEEMIFGANKITSGASSDIKMATKLARAMVMEWGMSDKVGMVYHLTDQSELYSRSQQHNRSEYMFEIIDREVKSIIDSAYAKSKKILEAHIDELHLIAKALIENETLTGLQVNELIAKHKNNTVDLG